jgi:hypothetical protein
MSNRISLVFSATALVVAVLGTTSVGNAAWDAVVAIPRHSVGTAQLKTGAVGAPQLQKDAVTSPKVKDNSLKLRDFAPAERRKLRGPRGVTGARGPAGPAGATGSAGAIGPEGPPGTARAYVTVRPDECFQSDNNQCSIYNKKNVASVRRISTGTYCVSPASGLSFDGVTPAVSVDAFNSGPASGAGVPIAAYSSLTGPCTAAEIKVLTYRATGATPTIALSNSTSFAIVIP